MNTRLFAAALLLNLAVSACSADDTRPHETQATRHVSPSPSEPMLTVTEPPPTTLLGRLGDEGNILEVGPRKVLLEARPSDDPNADQIIEVDRSTGARRVLVASQFDPGEFDSAAMVGDWLVYNDKRGAVTNGDVPYLWRVYALNLRTKERLLLDGNGHKPDLTWVTIKSRSGEAVWSKAIEGAGDFRAPFKVWKPGWIKPQTVDELPEP